jgi:hypothetical protein
MNPETIARAKTIILAYLAAQEPCTFPSIMFEVFEQVCFIQNSTVLPVTISAIAELQDEGKICEWEQYPELLENPIRDYCWQLSKV